MKTRDWKVHMDMDTQKSPESLEMLAINDPIFMFKNLHFTVTLGNIFVTTWYI